MSSLGPPLIYRHARDALATVPSEFWKGITHYFVVASLGGQNIGKSEALPKSPQRITDGQVTCLICSLDSTLASSMVWEQLVSMLGLDVLLIDEADIDMAFARLDSTLFIVLDTEGSNSAVEQSREAAHIDVRGCF